VTPGQTANYSVTLAPVLGFDQPVKLTCGGTPVGSACTLTPGSMAGSGTVNVAVVTAGSMGAFTQSSNGLWKGLGSLEFAVFALFGMGLLAAFMREPRRWRPQLSYLVTLPCLLLVAVILSCGGGGSGASGGGTPTGTYTLTVTGTFASGGVTLSHNTQFTLVVQ
jgi:hypothetical protein